MGESGSGRERGTRYFLRTQIVLKVITRKERDWVRSKVREREREDGGTDFQEREECINSIPSDSKSGREGKKWVRWEQGEKEREREWGENRERERERVLGRGRNWQEKSIEFSYSWIDRIGNGFLGGRKREQSICIRVLFFFYLGSRTLDENFFLPSFLPFLTTDN